jgi:hypothetical protein
MSPCRCSRFVCAPVFLATVVSASDPGPAEPGGTRIESNGLGITTRGPILHPRLPESVTAKVNDAIPVARKRLRDHRSCRELFARLGADGAAKLATTSYYPASGKQEKTACRPGVFALTTVGGSAVVLCRGFARLSVREAAIILIHEALHSAGHTEYPLDPEAPDAAAISTKVMKSCRLL